MSCFWWTSIISSAFRELALENYCIINKSTHSCLNTVNSINYKEVLLQKSEQNVQNGASVLPLFIKVSTRKKKESNLMKNSRFFLNVSPLPNFQLVSVLPSMNQGGFLEPVLVFSLFFNVFNHYFQIEQRSEYVDNTDLNPG